ncbi:hypothetical protein [Serratia symbiotica]|nr:hypothetical protein [Serratia symbiotica]
MHDLLLQLSKSSIYSTKPDHAEVLGRTIDKNILMIDEDNINKLSMGHAIVESNENNRCYFNGETVDSSVKSDLIEINVYCDEKE